MMVTPVDNTHPNDKVPTMDVDATTSLGSQQVEKVPVIVCNDRPISKNKENPDVGPWMAPPHGSTSSLAVIAADDTTKLVDDVASSNEEEMVDTLFSSAEEDMVTS
ncbi:hypothetical protein M0R45_018127 [Rubus argutus]|uniref:Uncharacterized protein n=1 Tax=Rubus argutus TaxID=59490 RepID=A0AAW1X1R0_RUBAR